MAIVRKLQKFGRLPTALLVNGADFLGVSLAESLLEQSSKVIIIDEFTESNRARVEHLMESELFTFADYSALETFTNDNIRVDYVFYFNHNMAYLDEEIDTKDFKKFSERIDKALKLGVKKKAKFLYASSMEVNRYMVSQAQHGEVDFKKQAEEIHYSVIELQRYCENLVMEYHKKSGLNARIIRLGEVFGEGMEVDRRSELARLLRSAVKDKKVTIYGEGLQTRYYLHLLDATYGLIKAQFGNGTNGEVFSLAIPEEISELSLAYKILEFNPTAVEVEFEEVDRRIFPSKISVPADNLSVIGWTPHVDFEKGLFKTLTYFYDSMNLKWKNMPKKEDLAEDEEEEKKVIIKPQEQKKDENLDKAAQKKDEPQPVEKETSPPAPEGIFEDETKRVVEVKAMDDDDEVVRVLPYEEGKRVKSQFFEKTARIPATVKDPDILRWVIIGVISIPIFTFIFLPVLRLFTFTAAGSIMSGIGYAYTSRMDCDKASWALAGGKNYFSKASDSLVYFKPFMNFIGLEGTYEQLTYLYSTVEHLVAAGESATIGISPWVEYLQTFEPLVNPNDTEPKSSSANLSYDELLDEMSDSSTDLLNAASEFREAEEAFRLINKQMFFGLAKGRLETLGDFMESTSSQVDSAISLVEYMPELMGKDERQNYLLLFQNPFEIRSTGGWIGGYGLVSLEEGQIRQLDVDDIYNADGKLLVNKTVISPPADMEKALDVHQWTLSLSNWNPDFQYTARDAEYLAKQILGSTEIDGVIAIDIYVLRDILGIIGEVDVGGEEGFVDNENLFDVIMTLREGFETGSQRKSSFLGRLGSEIMNSLLKISRDYWPQLGSVILENLNKKHILVAFDNPAASREVIENGWGGNLLSSEQCDFYFYPVDYNWSGNKVNAYIEQTSEVDLSIDDWDETKGRGNVRVQVSINYENSSTDESYEGGDYENYLRVYLPSDVQVISTDGFDTGSVRVYKEVGRTVIGGWVVVAKDSSAKIDIEFDFLLVENEESKYSVPDLGICVQKQPGLENQSATVTIDLPVNLSVRDSGTFISSDGRLENQLELDEDFVDKVVFQ